MDFLPRRSLFLSNRLEKKEFLSCIFVPLCLCVSLPLVGSYTLNGQECYFFGQEQGTFYPFSVYMDICFRVFLGSFSPKFTADGFKQWQFLEAGNCLVIYGCAERAYARELGYGISKTMSQKCIHLSQKCMVIFPESAISCAVGLDQLGLDQLNKKTETK